MGKAGKGVEEHPELTIINHFHPDMNAMVKALGMVLKLKPASKKNTTAIEFLNNDKGGGDGGEAA